MKQKCMTANAELFDKLIRLQRAELHEVVGMMISLEKELSMAKTSKAAHDKKLDKAN